MTKDDLVEIISMHTRYPKTEILNVIEELMSAIKTSLIRDEPVYLRGFGTFFNKKRRQKVARNINNGDAIIVPAHKLPSFKPGEEFAKKAR